MDRKTLISVTLAGTVAQLAMIALGHFIPVVRDHVFAVGGMLISLIAGGAYQRLAGGGWSATLIGGAIAGGVGAFIGILASAALGDTPVIVVAFGTLASTVAGIAGAALVRAVGQGKAQPAPPM